MRLIVLHLCKYFFKALSRLHVKTFGSSFFVSKPDPDVKINTDFCLIKGTFSISLLCICCLDLANKLKFNLALQPSRLCFIWGLWKHLALGLCYCEQFYMISLWMDLWSSSFAGEMIHLFISTLCLWGFNLKKPGNDSYEFSELPGQVLLLKALQDHLKFYSAPICQQVCSSES